MLQHPNPNPNRRCRSLVSVSWDGKLHACTVKVLPLAVPDPRLLGARLAALTGSALPGERPTHWASATASGARAFRLRSRADPPTFGHPGGFRPTKAPLLCAPRLREPQP